MTRRWLWLAIATLGCGSNGATTRVPDAAAIEDAATPPAARDAALDAVRDAGLDLAADALAGSDARDAASARDTAAPDVSTETDAPDAAAPDDASGAEVGADPSTPVTVHFWQHDNPAFDRAMKDAFAGYMAAHPGVTIAATTVSWQTLASALTGDLANDRFAQDLVLMPPSWTCSFAANLDEVPADVLTLAEAQNVFFAGPLAGNVCGGKLAALPLEYNLEYGGVVVNLDRYQARFPGKLPAWPDWASFIGQASMLARFDGAKPCSNGLDIDPGWPEPVRHIFLSQILQRGGHYWSATDGRLFDFDTPEAHAALAEMVGWVTQSKVQSTALLPTTNTFVTTRLAHGATGYGCGDVTEPLSVMGYLGSWGVAQAASELPPGVQTRFDYFAVPPMVGSEHKFVQNAGFALAVPRTSKNQRIAWDIVKALTLSPAGMRKWAATAGTLPALRVNGTPQAAASNPTLAKIQPLLERGQWVGYIPAAATDAVSGAILSNHDAAVRGTKTIDQALKDMQTTANQAIVQHP
jgi:multiple sugar transport system substrate-binding protein